MYTWDLNLAQVQELKKTLRVLKVQCIDVDITEPEKYLETLKETILRSPAYKAAASPDARSKVRMKGPQPEEDVAREKRLEKDDRGDVRRILNKEIKAASGHRRKTFIKWTREDRNKRKKMMKMEKSKNAENDADDMNI